MGDNGAGHEVRSDELELQARVLRIWEPKLVVLTDGVIQFFRPANPATKTQSKFLFELPCDKILVRPFPQLNSLLFGLSFTHSVHACPLALDYTTKLYFFVIVFVKFFSQLTFFAPHIIND